MRKLPKDTTARVRKALDRSPDKSDKAGVCPACFKPSKKLKKAVEQHDLEYILHDAGLTEDTREEADDNFKKNVRFATRDRVTAFVLGGLASLFGGLFW